MAYRQDHYVILGIGEDATPAEVRSAYRRAARTHHPDLNPGDAEAADRFKRVQEAYDILGNPARRAAYRRPLGVTARSSSTVGQRRTGRPVGRPDRTAAQSTTSADSPLATELAQALLALRLLARETQLERRLRRLVRYLEGL